MYLILFWLNKNQYLHFKKKEESGITLREAGMKRHRIAYAMIYTLLPEICVRVQ